MLSSLLPGILMTTLTLVTYGCGFIGLYRVLIRTSWERPKRSRYFVTALLLLLCWVGLLSGLALQGFFEDFSRLPPRIAIALFLPLPVALLIAFSRQGTELLRQIPPQWLLYLQCFRILVEALLWLSFLKGLIPVQMSIEGRNFDLLSGLFAIPVGYYCFHRKSWPRAIAILYNISGLLLLLNIIVISTLSMPTPLRHFHNEPANTIIGTFPFIFLPGMLVPLAYALHIFSLRQLAILRPPRTIAPA
jgi:hypothetical protein